MGGLCLIGEFMKNLSELIDKHEEIFGDQGADKIAKVLAKENVKFEFILDEGTM